jgi:hypothetical protein
VCGDKRESYKHEKATAMTTERRSVHHAEAANVIGADDPCAVLARHGASLFFGAPASLWIRGKDVGEVWSVEGDGSKLEPVDGWRS